VNRHHPSHKPVTQTAGSKHQPAVGLRLRAHVPATRTRLAPRGALRVGAAMSNHPGARTYARCPCGRTNRAPDDAAILDNAACEMPSWTRRFFEFGLESALREELFCFFSGAAPTAFLRQTRPRNMPSPARWSPLGPRLARPLTNGWPAQIRFRLAPSDPPLPPSGGKRGSSLDRPVTCPCSNWRSRELAIHAGSRSAT